MRTVLRPRPLIVLVLASFIAWGLAPRPAMAAWPNTPTTNLPVCTTAPDQGNPSIVSDGSGGAIIAFAGVYAQHVTASGIVDPAWPLNGRRLSTSIFAGTQPVITTDGAGGAIVAWQEFRGSADIYAQHILSTGVVDPAWPVEGRVLCSFAGDQTFPMIVPDGAGGAIVTWQDGRLAGNLDVFAQHVLASGAADPAWPANGLAICLAAFDQSNVQIAADGAGGAIVSWQDARGASVDIYAQHALSGGAVDPAWPVNGRLLCGAALNQTTPTIVADGAGGAIVTWSDPRSGSNDIYAQHVLANGFVDSFWPGDGRALCQAASFQYNPTIATDGAGGAIVAWQDLRGGASFDIYAQHVAANGLVDAAWPVDGRQVCGAAQSQFSPTIIPDGFGGAIIAWYDIRSAASDDIYAQHVKSDGTVDTDWPADGRAISTATNNQFSEVMASDGAHGAIVTWFDLRAGTGLGDVYAQRVANFGYLGAPEAEIVGVKDVPGDNGGKVKLSWNASYLDINGDRNLAGSYLLTAYDVLRSVPPQVAAARLRRGARAVGSPGEAVGPGGDRLLLTKANAQTYYWEFLISISALHYVSGYSFVAPTLEDSTSAGAPRTAFMVVARDVGYFKYWPSRPDSGYSVDNLPPFTPAPFTGFFGAGSTALHWDPNSETDLAGYRLYRGTSAGFVPGPSNLVAALTDTGYVDPAGAPYYYKLAAIDIHGNLSGFALLQPGGTLDVPGERLEFALDPVRPNPARGDGLIARFTLASPAAARIELLDVAGRRVAARNLGARSPGRYSINLSDRGRIPPGVYLVRLTQGVRSVTRRAAVLP